MRFRVPNEVVASIFAASTAFIGGNALHLPPWAIFISWAGTYLAGGPEFAVMKRLWIAMPAGSTFAAIIVLLSQTSIGTMFGTSTLAQDLSTALLILVVNTVLMYTGRVSWFSLVPAMFFGFASFFATYYGGFGWTPNDVLAAWVSVVAMNALGPVFAFLVNKIEVWQSPETAPASN